ncbi:hypothetical protein [Amycolatopsis sp. lyj-23]|uniref:hypothetical protein n=1 Tax=Amycolatopsis sp. lyj-23 TaxID=2789283 RepID=UPI00397E8F75
METAASIVGAMAGVVGAIIAFLQLQHSRRTTDRGSDRPVRASGNRRERLKVGQPSDNSAKGTFWRDFGVLTGLAWLVLIAASVAAFVSLNVEQLNLGTKIFLPLFVVSALTWQLLLTAGVWRTPGGTARERGTALVGLLTVFISTAASLILTVAAILN